MHWTLTTAVILVAWAAIGGLWRPSAVALVAAWGLGQLAFVVTGNELPLELYWITDPAVMYITWRWLGSKLDYAILAGFPVCWWAYIYQTGADQWWTLWFITCLQLFLAGPIPQIQRGLTAYSHGPRRAFR